jgi:broad specificity phosphatase PhoE
LSVLYLVRHGQAGTRENYDSLSPLGRRQAQLLGEYFTAENIHFDSVYSGALSRQQSTAAETLPSASVVVDPGWNEFDLAQVYAEYAPHLAADDADFRREYEAMQQALVESQGSHDAPVHRRWNDCDKKVVRAWVESRYHYSGESWPTFVARIYRALTRVTNRLEEGSNAIVFTSATPIGVCSARSVEIEDGRAMWMAGVLMNASFSTLRVRRDELRLFSFNNAPHLNNPTFRTFR